MKRTLLLLLLSAWCAAAAAPNPFADATPESFLGGAENLRLVTEATAVKVFRIVDPEAKPKPKKLVTMEGHWKCKATPVTVTGEEVQQLIAALADMNNFGEDFVCDFDPGVIVRFEAEEHHLDLVICFDCHQMALYRDGAIVQRPFKWAETRNGFMRGASRAFRAIARKAFPKDADFEPPKQ